jgi:hypothetical protein
MYIIFYIVKHIFKNNNDTYIALAFTFYLIAINYFNQVHYILFIILGLQKIFAFLLTLSIVFCSAQIVNAAEVPTENVSLYISDRIYDDITSNDEVNAAFVRKGIDICMPILYEDF